MCNLSDAKSVLAYFIANCVQVKLLLLLLLVGSVKKSIEFDLWWHFLNSKAISCMSNRIEKADGYLDGTVGTVYLSRLVR
jgi:hypothetical protein